MSLFIKLAWRNIWRYPKRSIVTMLLCIACTTFLIFFESFNQGSHNKMITDVVEMYPGYIHIHYKGFHDQPDYDHFIPDLDRVRASIKQTSGIKVTTPRLETPALFSSKTQSYGGMLVGIHPDTEQQVSRLKQALIKGRFLQPSDTNGVYIGKDLAKTLQLDVGDSFIFISSAMDRSIAADTVEIVGLFETRLFGSDAQLAFMNKSYMDDVFLSTNMASYLIVQPTHVDDTFTLQKTLQDALNDPLYEVFSWRELLSSFVQFVELDESMGRISIMIVVLVVFFVIMIFQFISIFGRTKEIGMVRAIGTPPWMVSVVMFLESLIMTLISIIIGTGIGGWLAVYFNHNPITMSFSDEVMDMYEQYGMIDWTIPTEVSLDALLYGAVIVFIINMLAIVYPLYRALQLLPREALRGSQR